MGVHVPSERVSYFFLEHVKNESGDIFSRSTNQPVPAASFTLGMPRRMIRCRRATRLGFTLWVEDGARVGNHCREKRGFARI